MITRFAISLVLGAMAAGGAWADTGSTCAAETRAADGTVPGEACAVSHFYAPAGDEELKPAENIWLGYVMQAYRQSDGCKSGVAQVVVDCADGTAFSVAPAGDALMTAAEAEAARAAYDWLIDSIREMPWGYEEVAGWERADELRVADLGSVREGPVALGLRGQSYDLTCGCKLFNPASMGAGE